MKDYYIENFLFPCRVDQQLRTKTVKYNILPGVQQVSDETKTQIRTKLELDFFFLNRQIDRRSAVCPAQLDF